MLFAILAHVDANDCLLVVEQEFGEALGQLGLANAGRAEEQERTGWAIRIADAGLGAANCIADYLYRALLTDQALAQLGLKVQQLFAFAGEQAAGRNTGPGTNHRGDVVFGHLIANHAVGVVLFFAFGVG